MPIFTPRTTDEVEQRLLARLVARSKLTDVAEGAVIRHALRTTAEEFEAVEFRMDRILRSFDFEDAEGTDLDERLAELPLGGIRRLGRSAASGPALRLTRDDTSAAETIPAGSVYASSEDPSIQFIQTEDVTFPVDEAVYPYDSSVSPVRVVCATRGEAGNVLTAGVVTRVVSAPPSIVAVTNVEPITGGMEREEDDQLKARGRAYLSSLAGSQPLALMYAALSYQTADGVRIRHAKVYEDPKRPGYTELMVDDGYGMAGYTKVGQTVTGTVPVNGQLTLYHEGPATEPITSITVNGAAYPTGGQAPPWTSLCERGMIEIAPEDAFLSSGDTWKVSGYEVFTGIIAELQRLIEGDPEDAFATPGKRAGGTRVRVVPPTVEWVELELSVVTYSGVDLDEVGSRLVAETVAFLQALGPGDPLLLPRLTCALLRIDGIRTLSYLAPSGDVYPTSQRVVLRTRSDLVDVS